jgi:hypothetical protein
MGDTEGYATWFGSALHSSDQYKFAAHVGIAMAAGAAAYFTGGASLALMGGQKAAAGAHIASMLVGGAGMTVTSRSLNTVIFHHPFLAPGTFMDKAVDFGGEVLHNTALMGVLKLGNIAGASLPIMDGEPVIAAAVNASRNFAIEFGSFTGFNMISSVSHVIDDRYPSMDDALSKDALLQNAAFILGLRVGHAGLNAAKFMTRHGLNAAIDLDARTQQFMRSAYVTRLLLSPLTLAMGIPGDTTSGKSAPTPVSDALDTLIATLGAKPNVLRLYQERPYKFWGILNLLDMGIPSALVCYRILKTQVDSQSRGLMNEFQHLLQDPKIKTSLSTIRDQGMRAFLEVNGIQIWSDKFKTGTALMDNLARAYAKMQWYVSEYLPTATAAGHMVGMEYEGRTHFRAYEEIVWPDDEPYTPPSETAGPSVRDRLALKLRDDMTASGYTVDMVSGKPHFGYTSSPIIFPTIFERYRVGNTVVRVEFLTGTGAVIVSVMSESDPNNAKTEHVKGAKTVFDPAVDTKAAKMIAEVLNVNTDYEAPERTIERLRAKSDVFTRRYLIQAKAADNDILKIWVSFNDGGTAELNPINGILCNEAGDYIPGAITIKANTYSEVESWIKERAAGNSVFAKKSDVFEGVLIKNFGVVTLTDEAHPYKEVVSPKLTSQNFDTWLEVVTSLGSMGITGTTPYNLVGTHIHGNLPTKLSVAGTPRFTVQPVLGILRAFIEDDAVLYDGIPSHKNRLGFIQRLPEWFKDRLQDPDYITDAFDRRQILRLAADLARDVKKYNAMNLSNHISALLAKMIDAGVYTDGEQETVSSTWKGEDYTFRVVANPLLDSHDIIRELDCATYTLAMNGSSFRIQGKQLSDTWVNARVSEFMRNTLYELDESSFFATLQAPKSAQRTIQFQGDEYQFTASRNADNTISVNVKQHVHLIRVAKDARKTTAEIRIPDAIFDRDTGHFLLNFYYAWSWWHGTGQFLNPAPTPIEPPIVRGAEAVFPGRAHHVHFPENAD